MTAQGRTNVEVLSCCPDLRGLDEALYEELSRLAQPLRFHAGETVYDPGFPTAGLYAIASGRVMISRSPAAEGGVTSFVLGPGGVFGEESLARHGLGVRVTSVGNSRLLMLPANKVLALGAQHPPLAAVISRLVRMLGVAPEVVRALRRSQVFRHVSSRFLYELLEGASFHSLQDQQVLQWADEVPRSFYVVIRGELHSGTWAEKDLDSVAPGDRPHGARAIFMRAHEPGSCLCELECLLGKPSPASIHAAGPAEVVAIHQDQVDRLLESSAAIRRSLRDVMVESEKVHLVLDELERRHVETVMLAADVPCHQGLLTTLLGEAMVSGHGDAVLQISLAPGEAGEDLNIVTALESSCGHLDLLRLPVPAAAEAAMERVDQVLRIVAEQYDYVLFEPPPGELARHLSLRMQKLVHLTRDTGGLLPLPAGDQCQVIYTALLDPPRSGCPARHHEVGACRLRLPLHTLVPDGAGGPQLAMLATANQERFARWVRAITDRRVGLSLGGGGAWGYAHVALIRALRAEPDPVPIDMISGSSFGAVVGAYWAADPVCGLEKVIADGQAIFWACLGSIVTSYALERLINRSLDRPDLEQLETAFFPVATDIATGTVHTMRTGSIGHGVRASGSMPPMFTPTTGGGVRLLDGGISSNVPVGILRDEGAHLVVACNIVPPPNQRKETRPLFGDNPLGRFLHEFNPKARSRDTLDSVLLMANTLGNLQAEDADVPLQTRLGDHWFWDFDDGPAIARETLARPSFQRGVEQVKARWRTLSAPRHERR